MTLEEVRTIGISSRLLLPAFIGNAKLLVIITRAKSILLQQVRNLIHEWIVKSVVDYIEAAQGKRIILQTIELQRLKAVTLPPLVE